MIWLNITLNSYNCWQSTYHKQKRKELKQCSIYWYDSSTNLATFQKSLVKFAIIIKNILEIDSRNIKASIYGNLLFEQQRYIRINYKIE